MSASVHSSFNPQNKEKFEKKKVLFVITDQEKDTLPPKKQTLLRFAVGDIIIRYSRSKASQAISTIIRDLYCNYNNPSTKISDTSLPTFSPHKIKMIISILGAERGEIA